MNSSGAKGVATSARTSLHHVRGSALPGGGRADAGEGRPQVAHQLGHHVRVLAVGDLEVLEIGLLLRRRTADPVDARQQPRAVGGDRIGAHQDQHRRVRQRREVRVDEVGVVTGERLGVEVGAAARGVEARRVRLEPAARAAVEAHHRVERPALLVEAAVHEPHVVVVVRVLDECLPVDRVLLVERAVVPRELLEPVAVVAIGERRDPLTERRRAVRQASEHELVPGHLDADRHQTVLGEVDAVGVHANTVGDADQSTLEVVAPVVVRARHRRAAIAGRLEQQARRTVPAVVQEAAHLAGRGAHHEHRLRTDAPGDVVAGLLEVFGVAQPHPRPAEHAHHLEVEQLTVVHLPRLQHRRVRARHEAVGLTGCE